MKIGDKVVASAKDWFVASDGKNYQAVYGILEIISEKYVTVSGCTIFNPCSVTAAEKMPPVETESWQYECGKSVNVYTRPSGVFNAIKEYDKPLRLEIVKCES
jgi:hypothetical protein